MSTRADILDMPLETLRGLARERRDARGPRYLTYSRKVFIPLTQLCRDVCGYCTFAKAPRRLEHAYLPIERVLEIARAGARAGCKEALFTLGDKPELRYRQAREELDRLGFATTVDYLVEAAGAVLRETGVVPHINAGVLTAQDYARLRPVAGSMGLMLEGVAPSLMARGGAHHGSPDKDPHARLESMAQAGAAKIPFTSGLLIGIGETRAERLDGLYALRDLHRTHGHLQEVIVQNFRAKPGTRMAGAPEPSLDELAWTIAAARLVLDPEVSVQSPPNLNPGRTRHLIESGIDDWGGISPVTIDHVNPEAAWPDIAELAGECADAGFHLDERLTAHPRFVRAAGEWLDPQVARAIRRFSDADGLARTDRWSPGVAEPAPGNPTLPLGQFARGGASGRVTAVLARAIAGHSLGEDEVVALFGARGADAGAIVEVADDLRRRASGDVVTYVVNRNINYTNICTYSCGFCAFSKTSTKAGTRDKPYDLPLDEIAARVVEARSRGATEVCLQGGIHPSYSGETYLAILRAVKAAAPDIHVHAFSPLEVHHGASTLGLPVADYLRRLRDAGLGSLPGTAAEILDDEVRAKICPDKLTTREWLGIVGAAHAVGLKTTSTIMFGHLDEPRHWARHILALRRQQLETGGFTEFVPLPFVHMQSPIYLRNLARPGPTWRESVLMHAVARIALSGAIDSVQASWVKLGMAGAAAMLRAGVNDLGGVLMNESISRAAGAAHGQEVTVADLEAAARSAGRPLAQRTTLYERRPALFEAVHEPCNDPAPRAAPARREVQYVS